MARQVGGTARWKSHCTGQKLRKLHLCQSVDEPRVLVLMPDSPAARCRCCRRSYLQPALDHEQRRAHDLAHTELEL